MGNVSISGDVQGLSEESYCEINSDQSRKNSVGDPSSKNGAIQKKIQGDDMCVAAAGSNHDADQIRKDHDFAIAL